MIKYYVYLFITLWSNLCTTCHVQVRFTGNANFSDFYVAYQPSQA